MGEIFRESQQHLLELTLWEGIPKVYIKIFEQLSKALSINVDETIEKIRLIYQAVWKWETLVKMHSIVSMPLHSLDHINQVLQVLVDFGHIFVNRAH
jgi:hypothetical protein